MAYNRDDRCVYLNIRRDNVQVMRRHRGEGAFSSVDNVQVQLLIPDACDSEEEPPAAALPFSICGTAEL